MSSLEEQHLVDKTSQVSLAETYQATLLTELLTTYNLETELTGKKEDLLAALVAGPKTVSELEQQGFPPSIVYAALDDLQAGGVVEETEEGYRIVDETLRTFLEGGSPGRSKPPIRPTGNGW